MSRLWAVAGFLLVVAAGMGRAQQLSFATASIREADPKGPEPTTNLDLDASEYLRYEGGPVLTAGSLADFILFAYHMNDGESEEDALQKQLPTWARDTTYVVRATVDAGGKMVTKDDLRERMKVLLAERFALKVHPEMREETAWVMTMDPKPHPTPGLVSRGDIDICTHPAAAEAVYKEARKKNPKAFPELCTIFFTNDSPTVLQMNADGRTMSTLAVSVVYVGSTFGGMASLPVVDRTGLKGYFDLHVKFQRVKDGLPMPEAEGEKPAPRFADALREQAGLVLTRQKAEVPMLIVDRVEKPTPD